MHPEQPPSLPTHTSPHPAHPLRFVKLGFALCIALLALPSAAHSQTASTTTLTVTSGGTSVSTVKEGTEVTLTATITSGGAGVVPGQVDFCEVKLAPLQCTDIRLISTVQLSSAGVATYNFYPGPGTHNFQAMFLGTHIAAASSSSTLPFVVTPFYPTTTSIAETGGPVAYTLTATVTGTEGTTPPTGIVSFLDTTNANYPLATAPLIPSPGIPGVSITNSANLPTQFAPQNVTVADFNGDGKLDLFVTGAGQNNVYLGNGNGTFAPAQASVFSGEPSYNGVTADFNGDGKPDMAFITNNPDSDLDKLPEELQIALGNGDGTFTQGQTIVSPSVPEPIYIATGDFNGDGIADLAVANTASSTEQFNSITVLLGNGDGTFTVKSVTTVGTTPYGIAVGDFNHDGKTDMAVVDALDNAISVLIGNGDGTFSVSPELATGNGPESIVAADFHGDGNLDLAVVNTGRNTNGGLALSGTVTIFQGKGDGTFTPLPTIPTVFSEASGNDQIIAVGDFNGDGKADLLVGGGYLDMLLLLGNGDGTFAPGTSVSLDGYEFNDGIAEADFNGDGLTDIAAIDQQQGTLAVFLDNSTPPSATVTVTGVSPVGTGTHLVDASYPGDSDYQPSISDTVGLTAEPVPTTLTLTPNPTTSIYGQQVTLTATINPSTPQQNHIPTGTVTFMNGTTLVGTGMVSNGAATFNTAILPTGTDTLTAAYSGDTNFLSSKASAMEVVNGAPSATILTAAPNPAGLGQPVTLTAAVAGTGLSITATGTVSFYDGATLLGSSTLDPTGHASYTTSTLSLGTHSLTAVYSSDPVFHASTSAPYTETIIQPSFALTLASPTISLRTYQHITTTATLASIGAFTDTISLACGNLPKFVTCTFTPNPASLSVNSTATVAFYIDTDSILGNGGSARNQPASSSPISLAFLLYPLGLFALLSIRRRRPRVNLVLLAILTLPLVLALGACGGNQITPVPSAAPGTYSIPITATGTTTHLTRTAQLALTITP